ncbi:MAG: hypothetical protein ACM3NZ_05920, partial [Betaproteobacteria bacterium]
MVSAAGGRRQVVGANCPDAGIGIDDYVLMAIASRQVVGANCPDAGIGIDDYVLMAIALLGWMPLPWLIDSTTPLACEPPDGEGGAIPLQHFDTSVVLRRIHPIDERHGRGLSSPSEVISKDHQMRATREERCAERRHPSSHARLRCGVLARRGKLALAAAFAAALLLNATAAVADEPYPSRPITLIVPFPPGGVADIVGRPFADALSRELKTPVVIENKPG